MLAAWWVMDYSRAGLEVEDRQLGGQMLQSRQEIIWSCVKESEQKWIYSGGGGWGTDAERVGLPH